MKPKNELGLGAALAAIVTLASGCATITGSETQNLSLQALDKSGASVADAECSLRNDKGSWSAKPPTIAVVTRSAEDLLVQCEAKGQEPGTLRAVSRANSGLFGNIIFGGGVGALIDHSKGTAYDYPSIIRVVFGSSLVLDKREEPGDAPKLPSAPASLPQPTENVARTRSAQGTQVATIAGGQNAPASAALPVPGSSYRYSWAERQYSRRQEFEVRVTGVDGWRVLEMFRPDGRPMARTEVDAREPMFTGRMLAEGQSLLEFAPYLPVQDQPGSMQPATVLNYPEGSVGPWSISIQRQGWEPVTVPAGTFRAQRLDIRGERSLVGFAPHSVTAAAGRFEYTAWYAPELMRYVKIRHRSWNISNSPIGDEHIELLEHRRN